MPHEPAPIERAQPPFNPVGVLNHKGEPLDEDLVFFSPPPNGIGRVISANSSLKRQDIDEFQRLGKVLKLIRTHTNRWEKRCSYVGEHGLAEAATRDGGNTISWSCEITFDNALYRVNSLRAHETIHCVT